MPVNLPLDEMTTPEKLQVMEALWEHLSRNSDALESPAWHQAVLEERDKSIADGTATFIDWDKAKADIRRQAA